MSSLSPSLTLFVHHGFLRESMDDFRIIDLTLASCERLPLHIQASLGELGICVLVVWVLLFPFH